jgi:hypothetical protein
VDPLSRNPVPAPPTEHKNDNLDSLYDSVGFPPTIAMIRAEDENDDPDLGFWGDEQYHCWIGRPRTPPVQPECNTAHFIRQPNVFPITFDELSSLHDCEYLVTFASSHEPRPALVRGRLFPTTNQRRFAPRLLDCRSQGSGSPKNQANFRNNKPLDPPTISKDQKQKDKAPPEPEKGSRPKTSSHKYKDEKVDFSNLDFRRTADDLHDFGPLPSNFLQNQRTSLRALKEWISSQQISHLTNERASATAARRLGDWDRSTTKRVPKSRYRKR